MGDLGKVPRGFPGYELQIQLSLLIILANNSLYSYRIGRENQDINPVWDVMQSTKEASFAQWHRLLLVFLAKT